MGLSGSDTAYRFAIADEEPRGKTRADSTRAGFFYRDVVPVTINGTRVIGVIQSSIRINLNTGAEPHRCVFDFRGGSGFVPSVGHVVTIGHGTTANALFSGRIIKATRVGARNDERRPTYQIDAAGYVFEMNAATVPYGLVLNSVTPRAAASHALAVSSPSLTALGFTADEVSGTLPVVATYRIGPHESIADSFGRMFRDIDAVWTIAHDRRVRAWAVADSVVAPSTITSSASHVWNVKTQATDLTRVFTRANVIGARTSTVGDVDLFTMAAAPVQSPEGMFVSSTTGFTGVLLNSGNIPFLLDDVYRDLSQSFTNDLLNAGQATVFLPASRATNTLTVVAQNVSSVKPLDDQRWYDIGGPVYVASVIGVYSATASSIAYNYWIPNGPGALTTDIGAFADIAPLWNKLLTVVSPAITRQTVVPAGAPLALYLPLAASSPVQSEVSSLFGAAGFGAVSKTFDDSNLTASDIIGFTSTALTRGEPSQWRVIEFETRDRDYDIARPAYVNIASAAEPSASAFSGAFVVQDIELSDFGRLTNTRGPVMSIRAGAVRRPTMWQLLRGEY